MKFYAQSALTLYARSYHFSTTIRGVKLDLLLESKNLPEIHESRVI
jgi:hypothetical protein